MDERTQILLASRDSQTLDQLTNAVDAGGTYSVERRLIVNGDPDPLAGRKKMPDIVVLAIGEDGIDALSALARRPPAQRPPLVVVGDTSDAQTMRLAMQAGARDFLGEPVSPEELTAALGRLEPECRGHSMEQRRSLAVIGAKGGSGASTVAVNLAHMFRKLSGFRTILADLDHRFGALHHYLDLQPKRGLTDALAVAHELDEAALDAFLTRHHSGVGVLASLGGVHNGELPADRFLTLLELLERRSERLVIDLPNHMDGIVPLALERVDKVVLVLQQSLPCLRNTLSMLETLERQCAIARENIALVVNRYHKNAAVTLDDIERALGGERELLRLPNQYQMVAESIEMGVPLYEHAATAQITKAMMALEAQLGGRRPEKPKSVLSKTFASLMRS